MLSIFVKSSLQFFSIESLLLTTLFNKLMPVFICKILKNVFHNSILSLLSILFSRNLSVLLFNSLKTILFSSKVLCKLLLINLILSFSSFFTELFIFLIFVLIFSIILLFPSFVFVNVVKCFPNSVLSISNLSIKCFSICSCSVFSFNFKSISLSIFCC